MVSKKVGDVIFGIRKNLIQILVLVTHWCRKMDNQIYVSFFVRGGKLRSQKKLTAKDFLWFYKAGCFYEKAGCGSGSVQGKSPDQVPAWQLICAPCCTHCSLTAKRNPKAYKGLQRPTGPLVDNSCLFCKNAFFKAVVMPVAAGKKRILLAFAGLQIQTSPQ